MIREIFNAITPENIKNNPLYSNVIELFLQEIEEKSKYSLNINEVFKSTNPSIKLQIIKTYLEDFYKILSGLQTTNLVGSAYSDVDTDTIPKIEDILTQEYITSSKLFKQSKGTKAAIGYVYNLVEKLNTVSTGSDTPFKIEEKEKFNIAIEGNLTAEVYDQTVKPLAHPAGFAYVYTQVLTTLFQDYFNMQTEYNDVILKVMCSGGNVFDFVGLGSALITGPAISGGVLTAKVTDVNTSFLTSYSYIWKDELNNILGTSRNLTLTDTHIGKSIFVSVKYSETIDSIVYNREVLSNLKTQINGADTVQVKDSIGRVFITGSAVYDSNLPISTPQNLRAEIFDSVGINYSTLKFEWKSNDLVVPVFNEYFPLNVNYLNKKISVTVSYTDNLGVQKTIYDEIDNLLNFWSFVGAVKDYGTAYRIVNVVEEIVQKKNQIRIEFNNGEFLEQTKSSIFTDIKWWGPCQIPNDYTSRILIKDFTTNQDLTTNQCSLELSFTVNKNSLIDDQMVSDINDAGILDSFWHDIDEVINIGNQLVIGGFYIGEGVSKYIREIIIEAENFYPTFGDYDYSYASGDALPIIGSNLTITSNGSFIIGTSTGLITIPCDTDEHFNIVANLTEVVSDSETLITTPDESFDIATNVVELINDDETLITAPDEIFNVVSNLTELVSDLENLITNPDEIFNVVSNLTELVDIIIYDASTGLPI